MAIARTDVREICESLQSFPDWSAPFVLVCNYVRRGNYVGELPY